MITNREEVIDKAFKVFLKMNYEKASISTLAKACGVVKTGVVYYFPHKLDLFMAGGQTSMPYKCRRRPISSQNRQKHLRNLSTSMWQE